MNPSAGRHRVSRRALVWSVSLLLLGALVAPEVWGAARGFYTRLLVLGEIVGLAREVYVDRVDTEALMEGAIDGLLDRLDPHSNYLPSEEAARLAERIRGSFGGVGIQYSIIDGLPTVIATIEGGPAERAGVRTGDRFVTVDGTTTVGWRMNDVQEHLRGEKGTSVTIGVRRSGRRDIESIDVIRGDIPLKSVPYSFMLNDSTGYVRIRNFARTTGEEAGRALIELRDLGMRHLVLDLRNNGGGDMNAAVSVASYFLPVGSTIVSQRGRWEPANETFYAYPGPIKLDVPVVVLINQGSASASEIVAGALQDTDRGLVVGRRSFGKGLVQRSFDLSNRVDDGGVLLLTVARYYTPTGRLIQRDYGNGTAQYLHDAMTGESLPDTANLKAYSTPSGRVVYGGGGIYPDVVVQRSAVSGEIVRLGNHAAFFRYADELASSGRVFPSEFAQMRSVELDDKLWRDFVTFAGDSATGLAGETLAPLREELAPYVLGGIAGRFVGPEARYRLLASTDEQLAVAQHHLGDAARLWTESSASRVSQ